MLVTEEWRYPFTSIYRHETNASSLGTAVARLPKVLKISYFPFFRRKSNRFEITRGLENYDRIFILGELSL